MLVTYGPLSRESIEADEAAEESRLLPGNCYFLGVLKGVERTLHRRAGEDRGWHFTEVTSTKSLLLRRKGFTLLMFQSVLRVSH